MRLFRPSIVFRTFYPEAITRSGTGVRTLCLTFDDGPDPASTPTILAILEKSDTSALFFCNGKRAEKYPDLINEIRNHGHAVGNHGYSHLNGFATSCRKYGEDVMKADAITSGKIFRPPYGRMTPCQYNLLRNKYKIILWDLMAYDFDASFGPVKCLKLLKKNIHPGSIVVLHDSPGSCAADILTEYIEFARAKGYEFGNSLEN